MKNTVKFIKQNKGKVKFVFPLNILFVTMTDYTATLLKNNSDIEGIYYGKVDPSIGTKYGKTAEHAIQVWNTRFEEKLKDKEVHSSTAEPILNDRLELPEEIKEKKKKSHIKQQFQNRAPALEKLAPYNAGFYDTSEYMIGSVGVIAFLPQGLSGYDPWSTLQELAVVIEVVNGLNFWQNNEPNKDLTFYLNFVYGSSDWQARTIYTPILWSHTDQSVWIKEIMGNYGYTESSYFDRVYHFNNDLRDNWNTDWAFAIFIVNSYYDLDGKFSDGYFAYAYGGGPFAVLTYDNGNYGINNMDACIAHETGHIFWALDEYAAASSVNEYCGYLNIQNGNHETSGITNDPCIMRSQVTPYTNNNICNYTKQMIGWRDTDSDGVYDIVDTRKINLTGNNPNELYCSSKTITGFTTVLPPYQNSNPDPADSGNNITILKISTVTYKLDGNNWSYAQPVDMGFNTESESFTFTLNGLTNGNHILTVRVKDTLSNYATTYYNFEYIANPVITLLQPNTGYNNVDSMGITIFGQYFHNGSTVKLQRTEQTDILATNINYISQSTITCYFNLYDKYPGNWNLEISYGQASGIKNDAFTILIETISPGAVTSLVAQSGQNYGEVILTWVSPGDDSYERQLTNGSRFVIKYSTYYEVNWTTANAQIMISTSSVNPGDSQSYTAKSLQEDTTYFFRLWTKDEVGNYSQISNGATIYIQPIPPATINSLTAYTGTNPGEVILSWISPGDDNNQGNISNGIYSIRYSSDTYSTWDDAPYQISWTTNTAPGNLEGKVITGLSEAVKYYFWIRVRDENLSNWSGISNKSTATAQVSPPPLQPTGFNGVAQSTGSIKWFWTDNANNETSYKVYTSTGGLLVDLEKDTTYWLETNLSPNTQYARYVKAINLGGESISSNLVSKYTLSQAPYSIGINFVEIHQISFSWVASNITYFKIDRSNDNITWIILKSSTDGYRDISYLDTGLLPFTTYYYRVYGLNEDRIANNSCVTVSTITKSVYELGVSTYISHLTGGTETKIKPGFGEIKVTIPSNAVTKDVYVLINSDPMTNPISIDSHTITTANEKIKTDVTKKLIDNSIIELNMFDLTGTRSTDTFSHEIVLTIPYPDENNDGFIDNVTPSVKVESFRVVALNKISQQWELPEGNQSLDKTKKTVSVSLRHFSVYALIAVMPAETNLSKVYFYPNPLRLSLADKKITFVNLADYTKLKIFTISGELVYEEEKETPNGILYWYGRNNSGEEVASGVYIYLISNNNGEKKTGKIAVIK
jgi:hypothetical protein